LLGNLEGYSPNDGFLNIPYSPISFSDEMGVKIRKTLPA
jgi:hypothetical protein